MVIEKTEITSLLVDLSVLYVCAAVPVKRVAGCGEWSLSEGLDIKNRGPKAFE